MAHFACEENVGNRVCFAIAEEGRQTAQKVPVYQNLRTFFIMRWFAESALTIGAAGDGVLFAVIQSVFSKSNVIKISKPYLMHTLNFEMLLS